MRELSREDISKVSTMMNSEAFMLYEQFIDNRIENLREQSEAPVEEGVSGVLNQQQLIGGIKELKNLKLSFAIEIQTQLERIKDVEK